MLFLKVPSFAVQVSFVKGGIHGTVVARWTACQQVELSNLHQGHDKQNSSLKPGCPRPSITPQSAEPCLQTPFI